MGTRDGIFVASMMFTISGGWAAVLGYMPLAVSHIGLAVILLLLLLTVNGR